VPSGGRAPETTEGMDIDTEEETFEYGTRRFDIQKAKEIIRSAPREIRRVDPAGIPGAGRQGIAVDAKTVAAADTSKPILMATVDGESFPIDGWHRLTRAQKDGLAEIGAVYLTEAETRAVLKKEKEAAAGDEFAAAELAAAEVTTTLIDPETGAETEERTTAAEALDEIEATRERYLEILECVS